MITHLRFHNFRILQDAILPLGRITVIIGPNGSGKSTALQGIRLIASRTVELSSKWSPIQLTDRGVKVEIVIESSDPLGTAKFEVGENQATSFRVTSAQKPERKILQRMLGARVYTLDSSEIAKPCNLEKTLEMGETGVNLASVLTSLQDQFPERFESLNLELRRWMPEFDRILLDTVQQNQRSFLFRTVLGKHRIPAHQLSQGNLIAVALLTLSHLPTPPSIIALEEIDRGIHPRLLRDVQDAVNRLAYPENFGDDRKPVQVIMTSHSPYFLDLFRDHPEDIVIAEKSGLSARFHRLVDMPNVEDILRDSHLGEAWFSGVLGGVPAGT